MSPFKCLKMIFLIFLPITISPFEPEKVIPINFTYSKLVKDITLSTMGNSGKTLLLNNLLGIQKYNNPKP